VLVVTREHGKIVVKGQRPKSDAQFQRTLDAVVAYRVEAA
jgi:hypothetical protein